MSWLWGSATNPQYEELVEQACSPMKLPFPQGEDIALNLEITDMIRSKTVQPKPAMQSLKKRVASPNGRVQMYALSLVDTCIKNGGDHFLAEIASKEFVDEISNIIKSPSTNPEVKTMTLQMFQSWALAFESRRELAFLVDVYHELKNSGIAFPPPPVQSAKNLLDTSTAPAWVDSDVCMRCRTAFTFTNRKHHCRNCGLVFDQACSSRAMPLPKYGIKEDVRVCESCWVKAGKNKPAPDVPGRTPRSRKDYDADLQRAIELSLAQSQPGQRSSEPPLSLKQGALDDEDEQMRLAIEASLREMERVNPSAQHEEDLKPLPTFDLSPRETETILTFSNTLDQMAAYGERDLRRFPHAHILHDQAVAVGGKLQRNAEEKGTKAQMLYEMQAKLSEAIARYGQILDGQQEYAARKAHEARQAQYQQYNYGYQPPQKQGYYVPPQPYANGHSIPSQPQHAPPAQAAHAPSMYPSVVPQQYPQQQQQYQPWAAAGQPQQHQQWQQPQHLPPQQQPHAWQQPSASRQASYSSPLPSQPSEPYARPSDYRQDFAAPSPAASAPAPEQRLPSSPSAVPSAPPIDLHSLSPKSVTSALPTSPQAHPSQPLRSASYSSQLGSAPPIQSPSSPSAPLQSPSASLHSTLEQPQREVQSPAVNEPAQPNPWTEQSAHPQQQPYQAQRQQSYSQQQPQQQQHQPQQQQQQPQQQQAHQPQQQQQQQQQPAQPSAPQQGWYTASMFPSAPQSVEPAVDLPSAPTQLPEPAKAEEALLIEL